LKAIKTVINPTSIYPLFIRQISGVSMNISLICTDNESQSFGMRAISADIKKHGHHARLIFMETSSNKFSELNLQDLFPLVYDSDVIGFSCLAQGSSKAKQIIEFLRPFGKVTVWGGVHASLNPQDCANWADFVCLGEGEGVMIDLIERLQSSRDCKDILNIAYKENGSFVMNDLRPLITSLDELPLPDFSFVDEYHLTKDGFEQVFNLYNVERNAQISFTSSRGCAFKCTYCCNRKLKNLYHGRGHYVRRMSVPKLIEHTKHLQEVFPNGKYFYFIDEDFAARPDRELVELAERFPKEIGLPFEILAHPARITEKKLDLLAKAGMFRIRLGIETGSERTKKEIYDRHVSNEAVKRAAHLLSKSPEVAPVYFFITSNPYEHREDLLETLCLIESLPPGFLIQAFELIFFPGSELHERAVKDGYIAGHFDGGHEHSYYGKLHHKEYSWKKKNLYLNGLIFLMGGYCNRYRLGIIPRFMLNLLINARMIEFNEKHTFLIQAVILLKADLWKARHRVAQLVKRVINDPIAIYNPGNYLKKKISIKL
jgi:anaerobic magnesium-protoporphyrin IX monomethyl ester cyclase